MSEPRYLCERCGGTGRQEAGCWSRAAAYDAPAGVCDTCKGEGLLGPVRRSQASGDSCILLTKDQARELAEALLLWAGDKHA